MNIHNISLEIYTKLINLLYIKTVKAVKLCFKIKFNQKIYSSRSKMDEAYRNLLYI